MQNIMVHLTKQPEAPAHTHCPTRHILMLGPFGFDVSGTHLASVIDEMKTRRTSLFSYCWKL